MCKTCLKCKIEKPIELFCLFKRNKDGYDNWCKECRNTDNKRYRKQNPEKVKIARKLLYDNNIEKMRQDKVKYGAKHKPEKKAYDVIYREENKIEIAEYKKNWEKNKFKTDPTFKVIRNLRRRIAHALKGENKSARTIELLGCSIEEFKKHIEKQFQPEMSWENYGSYGWHIDHIKPCYTFDMSRPEHQLECFNYKNQRPLWSKDNLSRPRPDYIRFELKLEQLSSFEENRQAPPLGLQQNYPPN